MSIAQFQQDVEQGLSAESKYLSSKYFYDQQGDKLFKQIMHLPEYYLTRCELEIFQQQHQSIIDAFDLDKNEHFELLELGAGDGLKTRELLKELLKQSYDFTYLPVDISNNALAGLCASLRDELPSLKISRQQGNYFDILASHDVSKSPRVVLFLGSNLGNMTDETANTFIDGLAANLGDGDKVLLGLDIIKSKSIILPAYNDTQGVTSRFNLNLLHRINRELGGNFVVEDFAHRAEYSEHDGIAKSYLASQTEQKVFIKALGKFFDFARGERILTEISRKYDDDILHNILDGTGFKVVQQYTDSRSYFVDYILTKCGCQGT